MNDHENRRHQVFVRVRDFGQAHASDFAAGSFALQLFTSIGATITTLDGHAADEASGRGEARQGTQSRSQARAALREDLEEINRTARAMADDMPGLDDKFRMSRGTNDSLLLNAARAFKADAAPFKTNFIAHELPSDFLEDLQADIDALELAISNQGSGVGNHVAAGAGIDVTVTTGVDIVRMLDAIVRNKYANNPAALAEFTSASHTERAPRRSESAAPPPPPSQGSTPQSPPSA